MEEQKKKSESIRDNIFSAIKRYRAAVIVGLFLGSFVCQYTLANQYVAYKVIFDWVGLTLASMGTVFLADAIINDDYRKQIKGYLYEIIGDENVMENFIDHDHREKILNVALRTTLGHEVAEAIDKVIINNYLNKNSKLYRKDYTCILNLKNYDANFFKAEIQISFECSFDTKNKNLYVCASGKDSELAAFKDNLEKEDIQEQVLYFPFLLARNIQDLLMETGAAAKPEEQFQVAVKIDNQPEWNDITMKNDSLYLFEYPLDGGKKVFIKINTYLNKKENMFYDDIKCTHLGYHFEMLYDSSQIVNCACYHSCESEHLSVARGDGFARVDITDIVLPENNFVFFWECN